MPMLYCERIWKMYMEDVYGRCIWKMYMEDEGLTKAN